MTQGQQQLDSSLAALSSSYPRLQMPSSMMQGLATASPYPGDLSMLIFNLITFPLPASYPSTDQNPYPSLSMESSPAFYGSLVSLSTHAQHLATMGFKIDSMIFKTNPV